MPLVNEAQIKVAVGFENVLLTSAFSHWQFSPESEEIGLIRKAKGNREDALVSHAPGESGGKHARTPDASRNSQKPGGRGTMV